MSKIWLDHPPLKSCADYLPKAKRRNSGIIAQCRICGRLYRNSQLGYGWISTSIKEEDK